MDPPKSPGKRRFWPKMIKKTRFRSKYTSGNGKILKSRPGFENTSIYLGKWGQNPPKRGLFQKVTKRPPPPDLLETQSTPDSTLQGGCPNRSNSEGYLNNSLFGRTKLTLFFVFEILENTSQKGLKTTYKWVKIDDYLTTDTCFRGIFKKRYPFPEKFP